MFRLLAPPAVLAAHVAVWRWAVRRCGDGPCVARAATLRALGLVYAAAFATVALSLEACFGDDGLEPVALYMQRLGRRTGMGLGEQARRFVETPTLLWFVDSGGAAAALKALVCTGLGLSLLIVVGCSHCAVLAAVWLGFLSTVNVGQRMLGYGWHPQLCEFGFLCIFLGTFAFWDTPKAHGLCPAAMWLLRWLLFRSLFEPGVGKFLGGDRSWWPDLDALTYHYFTQPCPNPLAWFMDALPASLQVLSCIVSHLAECLLPVCLLLPLAHLRHTVACVVLLFMAVLVLTGNYAYLQYMMLAQTVPAFSDAALASAVGVQCTSAGRTRSRVDWAIRSALGLMLALFVLRRSVPPLSEVLGGARAADRSYDNWHLVNGYGAFSHMTKTRPEVVIAGRTPRGWEAVEFWCKVGDPTYAPCVISPLDLPIDWSLWFVPLGSVYSHPWFFVLLDKILCGSPALGGVVRYLPLNVTEVRAEVYEYTFSSRGVDWPQVSAVARRLLAQVWECSDRRDMPWEFLVDVVFCTAAADVGELKEVIWSSMQRHWNRPWWVRRKLKTVVPPVTRPVLEEMLQQNNLPVGCKLARAREEL